MAGFVIGMREERELFPLAFMWDMRPGRIFHDDDSIPRGQYALCDEHGMPGLRLNPCDAAELRLFIGSAGCPEVC